MGRARDVASSGANGQCSHLALNPSPVGGRQVHNIGGDSGLWWCKVRIIRLQRLQDLIFFRVSNENVACHINERYYS